MYVDRHTTGVMLLLLIIHTHFRQHKENGYYSLSGVTYVNSVFDLLYSNNCEVCMHNFPPRSTDAHYLI